MTKLKIKDLVAKPTDEIYDDIDKSQYQGVDQLIQMAILIKMLHSAQSSTKVAIWFASVSICISLITLCITLVK